MGGGAADRQAAGVPDILPAAQATFLAHSASLIARTPALRLRGATSLRAIATVLNARNIPTPRGRGAWQAGTVSQLLARLPAEA